jgi:hypothetical protein
MEEELRPKPMKGVKPTARSRKAAVRGVHSLQDVANVMSGLMTDVMTGDVSPAAANKLCAEVGNVLKGKDRNGSADGLRVAVARGTS